MFEFRGYQEANFLEFVELFPFFPPRVGICFHIYSIMYYAKILLILSNVQI